MLKKISVDALLPGMFIHEFCGPWMEHPFWREKFVLKDPADMRRIAESGIKEVWIDIGRGADIASDMTAESIEQAEAAVTEALVELAAEEPAYQKLPLAAEVCRAAAICGRAKKAVVAMFQEARMGQAIDTEAIGEVVDEISSSLLRNPGALIGLARLKSADDYTYMHSVAVCALMVSLGRQLGLSADEAHIAGMAGLVHDIGKALTPLEVLNKPGKLSDEEFAVIRQHPVDGHQLLLEDSVSENALLDVCLHHHEKVDGSGYPNRHAGEEISLYARMCAVCDVYDAVTSNRPYKAGWNPAESIRKMADWCKGHFDERVFRAFVKSVGIYPVGSLVRLESGRLGIVVEQAERSLLAPVVKVFFSTKSQTHVRPELVDLSRQSATDRIVGSEEAAVWGFKNLDAIWAAA